MPDLVCPNQGAFIRGHNIRDSYCVVQFAAKLQHARHRHTILLKEDIAAKAFDSVSWAFLLNLLQHMGFSRRWINWVSAILSSASTRVLLNGHPGAHLSCSRPLTGGPPVTAPVRSGDGRPQCLVLSS
jgi:hypothetical protein